MEEWKRDIKDREEELLKTVKGKKQIATVEQSSMYLKPLFKALRTRVNIFLLQIKTATQIIYFYFRR